MTTLPVPVERISSESEPLESSMIPGCGVMSVKMTTTFAATTALPVVASVVVTPACTRV